MANTNPLIEQEEITGVEEEIQEPAKVILFNDEVHTFVEVINQIMRATGCGLTKAEALTLQVHHEGKAIVYYGEIVKCMQVSSVLEEIELLTQIEV